MKRAFAELFGFDVVQHVPMAGRTDRWIINELASRHGLPTDPATARRIRDRYLSHLRDTVVEPGPSKGVLPGVRALLGDLSSRPGVHLALLTGNMEAGARIKLEHFELWAFFEGGGFGDVHADRVALFQQALGSVHACRGTRYQPEDAVVVGDTPLDVDVAVASGARSLGVATGGYDVQALREAGADVVLPDLENLEAVLDALGLADTR